MFKIILFMHGRLAAEFIRASAMVFGEQPEMESYGLELGCNIEELSGRIRASILKSAAQGQEVLVLTDLMNGTPFNTMMQFAGEYSFRHFTGINFPLFLEVLNRRMTQELAAAVNGLEKAAKNSIYDCDAFLEQMA